MLTRYSEIFNELKHRFIIVFYMVIFLLVICFFMSEHMLNTISLLHEVHLNTLEEYNYKEIPYNNMVLIKDYEADWYINYNINLNSKNLSILRSIFFYNFFILIILPYLAYEIYLFIRPALYDHELIIINNWYVYNKIVYFIFAIFSTTSQHAFTGLYFNWSEDSYIYLYNEWIDVHIDIAEEFHDTVLETIIYFLLNQILFIFYYTNLFKNEYIYTNTIVRRYITSIFIFILFIIGNFFNLSYFIILKYIFYIVIITELLIIIRAVKLFRDRN